MKTFNDKMKIAAFVKGLDETRARAMLSAGLEWLEANPTKTPALALEATSDPNNKPPAEDNAAAKELRAIVAAADTKKPAHPQEAKTQLAHQSAIVQMVLSVNAMGWDAFVARFDGAKTDPAPRETP